MHTTNHSQSGIDLHSVSISRSHTHIGTIEKPARVVLSFSFSERREKKNNAKDIAEIDVANESHFHQQISGIFRWSCVHAATNGLHFSGQVVRFCVLFHAHNHDDNSQQQQRRQTLSYTSRFCAVLLLLLLLFSTHLFLCGACFGFQSETICSGTWKGRFAYETEMTRVFFFHSYFVANLSGDNLEMNSVIECKG